ncbi:MAG: rhomboid family intramembrane serine protease [Phycisphaerales bacterium]|nr:rhomboid family intramembrane serine protease [Phycisphaerales bacterium]MCB9857089.1 rhomboid family intramembrane serine protease [Phycisphaerales bacterium]MCB9861784.1 rhomboid family intramembrane serine protease [Phycisphaerales bacterium]
MTTPSTQSPTPLRREPATKSNAVAAAPKPVDFALDELSLAEMTLLPDPVAQRLAAPAPPVVKPADHACPSCNKVYPGNTKICVACGVNIKTGRSLITASEGDLDRLYHNAEKIIRSISWIIAIGVYPIGSEAFGAKKPYAIFSIVAFTIFISSIFYALEVSSSPRMQSLKQLLLWPPDPSPDSEVILLFKDFMPFGDDTAFEAKYAELEEANPLPEGDEAPSTSSSPFAATGYRDDLVIKANDALPVYQRPIGEFRVYQLLTNALLHGDLFFHLGGKMFFLVIFGTRVNALIGNLWTAIAYPLLAIGASIIYLIAESGGPPVPALGASGAVMGLAGMYFVFFPVHKMHMAAWWRWGLLTGFRLSFKIWAVRGFWVVLFYIAFDVLATILGADDGVAHWAHLGGFVVGIGIALILLIARRVNAHGGDVLSVLLGRHAWKLIGRPRSAAVA